MATRRGVQDEGQSLSHQRQLHDSILLQRYYEDLTSWKRLDHPNVVLTLGASLDIAEFCVVSPWMPEGELLQYLLKHPEANRVAIVRVHVVHASDCTEFHTQDDWSWMGFPISIPTMQFTET